MKKTETIIKITLVLLLLGRTIQHLFFDSPIRGVLYSKHFVNPILQLLNINFNDYINSPNLDDSINTVIIIIGILFLTLSGLTLLLYQLNNTAKKIVLYFSCFMLVLIAFGYFKEKSLSIGQFFEYSSQMFLPLFFLIKKQKQLFFFKLTIGITFFCHGLYAIGYYPIPANFVQMIISGTSFNNEQAFIFLHLVGVLDFIFAIAIFIPKIETPFLWYGVIWGFLTSFARIYTNVYVDFFSSTLFYWIYEFLVRIPHFIIPLYLILMKKNNLSFLKRNIFNRRIAN
ncbi:MAG: hypothetical protein VR77_10040 [Flavobacteriales bacterium BRH_c54]|nr:MAG: hypothetical protein VR77_10040 [Flavobacteriales bacterium BRH_c54]